MKEELIPYKSLINSFVEGFLLPRDFQIQYLELFKACNIPLEPKEYEILNNLFSSAESYCADPTLRDEYDIDEAQLLNDARKSLIALSTL